MSRPILSGRLAKWALLLSEFEINYVPQRAIKGQALANFLADHPIPAEWELTEQLPDEEIFFVEVLPPWRLYFDGAARKDGAGAGVIFISPNEELIPYSFVLTRCCSNNMAEYQALIIGLGIAVEMDISLLEVFGDSALVIKQLLGEFEVKKVELLPHWRHARKLMAKIQDITLKHVPRAKNGPADTLAGIAASLAQFEHRPGQVPVCERWMLPSAQEEIEDEEDKSVNAISVYEVETEDWRSPLIDYLQYSKLPADPKAKVYVRKTAPKFFFFNNTLYRRSYEGPFLRCLSQEEGHQVLEEIHSGICGAHQTGPKLHLQVKRLGYYWPTMLKDSIQFARLCRACQFHGDFIHQPSEVLHPTVASWPFEAWGMDIIGPIAPKSSGNHQYILAATDYFSKWAEAAAF